MHSSLICIDEYINNNHITICISNNYNIFSFGHSKDNTHGFKEELIDEYIFNEAMMVFNETINQYCMFVNAHKLLC